MMMPEMPGTRQLILIEPAAVCDTRDSSERRVVVCASSFSAYLPRPLCPALLSLFLDCSRTLPPRLPVHLPLPLLASPRSHTLLPYSPHFPECQSAPPAMHVCNCALPHTRLPTPTPSHPSTPCSTPLRTSAHTADRCQLHAHVDRGLELQRRRLY